LRRFRKPRALPRRCSSRPLIASIGPLEVPGGRRMPARPLFASSRFTTRHSWTARSGSRRCPTPSRPRSSRRQNVVRSGRAKVPLARRAVSGRRCRNLQHRQASTLAQKATRQNLLHSQLRRARKRPQTLWWPGATCATPTLFSGSPHHPGDCGQFFAHIGAAPDGAHTRPWAQGRQCFLLGPLNSL